EDDYFGVLRAQYGVFAWSARGLLPSFSSGSEPGSGRRRSSCSRSRRRSPATSGWCAKSTTRRNLWWTIWPKDSHTRQDAELLEPDVGDLRAGNGQGAPGDV